METVIVLKTDISVSTIDKVSKELVEKKNLTVAICNVNTLVRCYKNEHLNQIVNSFDIKCSDGFPVAKSSNFIYKNNQKRVDGYNLFLQTLEKGLNKNKSHYFFGNTQDITKKMIENIKKDYPEINIVGYKCPPILSPNELVEEKFIQEIIELNPDIVWVSLGFPKQEIFINMLQKKGLISSNLIGIGAVFEWIAGTKIKAPEWAANLGLEWIIRLIQEPKRLFRRYLIDNFLFIIYIIKQYISK